MVGPLCIAECRVKVGVALEHAGNTHTVQDVCALIRQNRLQVWVDDDSILLTEIAELPSEKLLHYFLATGSLAAIKRLRREALAWAHAQGCTMELLTGRPGWQRVAEQLASGWNQPMIQMSRKLTCQE